MNNPFSIDTTAVRRPMVQVSEDLRGLTAGLQQEKAKQAKAAQFQQAYQSKNPDAVAQFMAENPDMQKQITAAVGHRDESTKNSRLITQRKILADPESAIPTLERHIAFVRSQGGDTTESEQILNRFKQGDPTALNDTVLGFAMQAPPQMWQAYRQMSGQIDEKRGLASAKSEILPDGSSVQVRPSGEVVVTDPSGEVVTGARRLEVLKMARESGLGLAREKSDIKVTEAGRAEAAKLGAKMKLSPQVESAVAQAVGAVKEKMKAAGDQKSKQSALDVYEVGMGELVGALQDTETGPIIGLIPAITANQQIAKGASAVMLPVLKQIFRQAGEGVFTDKDQELLENMLPTRKDKKEAIAGKLEMIDTIVRAKLGSVNGDQTKPAPQQQQATERTVNWADL